MTNARRGVLPVNVAVVVVVVAEGVAAKNSLVLGCVGGLMRGRWKVGRPCAIGKSPSPVAALLSLLRNPQTRQERPAVSTKSHY
jgi:hypothetical protein